MGRRAVLLIAGWPVAALGTTMVYLYGTNVQAKADQDAELVTAWVAAQPISVGTAGAVAMAQVEAIELPRKAVPGNALTDAELVQDKFVAVPIAANQVVLASMFGDPQDVSELPIPKGRMGVAVQRR